MKMKNIVYMCDQCKNKFEFGNIRYTNDGKKLVCLGCYSKIKKQTETKKPEIIEPVQHLPDVIKVICVKCRYKFSLNRKSKAKVMCPYCGGNNLMIDGTTAEKLVEEASHEISHSKNIRENIAHKRQKLSL